MRDFRIHTLELKGYNRLKPNAIEYFRIDLTNPYQIIIGTNGSGKSSIMRELTPLPANPKEYSADGYKIICVESMGQYYKLVNDFRVKTHFFYVTDPTFETELDNLNPSGNISTQRKLAFDTFGYDAEIAAVLLQDHDYRFTRMSKNMRKEWMLRLGNINLDFAIRLHRTLKQKHNEQIAVVKHLKRRIGDEEVRRISDEEIAELQRKSKVFSDELTELLYAIIPDTSPVAEIRNHMRTELNQLNSLAQLKPITSALLLDPTLINIGDVAKDPTSYIAAMHARINEIRERGKQDSQTIDRLYRESDRIRTLITTLHANAAKSVHDLQTELSTVESTIATKTATLRVGYNGDHIPVAMTTRDDFRSDLETILTDLVENPDDYLNRDRYNSTTEDNAKLQHQLQQLGNEITRVEHQLEHMAKTDATECPQCKHSWYPLTNSTPEALTERLRAYNEQKTTLTTTLALNAEYMLNFDSRRVSLIKINDLRKRTEHAVFIRYLIEHKYWERSNKWIMQELHYWYHECQVQMDIQQLHQRRDVLNAAITTASEIRPDDITSERISQLDDEINTLITNMAVRDTESQQMSIACTQLDLLHQNQQAGMTSVRRLMMSLEALLASSINEHIDQEMRERQTALGTIENALRSAESIIAVLDSLGQDLKQAQIEMTVYGLLEEEISPTRGLIAEYITDFIRLFTDQLNSVVKQIWNQRLEVQPCGFDLESDSGELDYRFPLVTGLETTGDVSKGSSAQRDMIDFAFVIVVYLYSGMSHYPLYIDELAPTMDDLHRVRITQYVKQLMENNHHSQMFMISHYISGHGVFASADFCILSETNILHKPKEFNRHVLME